MGRVQCSVARKKKKKRLLKAVTGFSRRRQNYRQSINAHQKAMQYAYRDRRAKKREFKSLWIVRINAASRINGLSYSRLVEGLRHAEVTVDRKMLADLAANDLEAFSEIAKTAKQALEKKAAS